MRRRRHFFVVFRFISLWLISISSISSSSRILFSSNIRCPSPMHEYLELNTYYFLVCVCVRAREWSFWSFGWLLSGFMGYRGRERALMYCCWMLMKSKQHHPTNRTRKKSEFVVRQQWGQCRRRRRTKQISHSIQITIKWIAHHTPRAVDFSLSIILTNMFFSEPTSQHRRAHCTFFSGGFHCFCGTYLTIAIDCLPISLFFFFRSLCIQFFTQRMNLFFLSTGFFCL